MIPELERLEWEQTDTTAPPPTPGARAERTRALPSLECTFRSQGAPPAQVQLLGRRGRGGSRRPRATEPAPEAQPQASGAPRGKEEDGSGEWPVGLLPWLAGRRAGRAGGSGGARAGRASVGNASLHRAPRALGTPPPPPLLLALVLPLVLPPVLPSPLALRPPRPGSNILRRLEHARLENNTTFQKPFQERPVPEGKEPGLLLLF